MAFSLAGLLKDIGFEDIANSRSIVMAGILRRTGVRLATMPSLRGLGKVMARKGLSMYPSAVGYHMKDYLRDAAQNMATNWWGGTNGWGKALRVGALAGSQLGGYMSARVALDKNRPGWERIGAGGVAGLLAGGSIWSMLRNVGPLGLEEGAVNRVVSNKAKASMMREVGEMSETVLGTGNRVGKYALNDPERPGRAAGNVVGKYALNDLERPGIAGGGKKARRRAAAAAAKSIARGSADPEMVGYGSVFEGTGRYSASDPESIM
jgi:hypothetical protein